MCGDTQLLDDHEAMLRSARRSKPSMSSTIRYSTARGEYSNNSNTSSQSRTGGPALANNKFSTNYELRIARSLAPAFRILLE